MLKDWLGKHHEYDQRGNLIAKSENGKQETFRWNGYNRLIQYTKDNQTTEYKYDPFGRRIAKIHNGTTTLFHWDGDVLSAESDANGTTHYIFEPDTFEPVAQFNSAPLRPQTPLTFRDYTYYTPDIDPLNQEPTPQEYLPDGLAYFHLDHLGTPIEMTDQTGNTVWEASYKAWGEVETVSGSLKQPFRFQGQYFDEESGLHYNRFRYYDPSSGRFVSQDPIGLLGGFNLYEYAPNPIEWVDPFGLKNIDCHKDKIAHNGYYSAKELRTIEYEMRHKSNAGQYTKHVKAKTEQDAQRMSSNGGAAQYLPNVNRLKIEKQALIYGQYLPQKDGSAYFIYKAPHIVGYDDGKPTYWIRAEVTGYVKGKGGFFHGHPMSESRALSTIASNFNKNCGL